MYKGIIFDLDGTLVDTAEDLMHSLNYALETYKFPKASLEETKSWIGNGIRNLVKRAVPEDVKENNEVIDNLYATMNRHYLKHCTDHTKAYDGVEETLAYLNKENIPIAITSNKQDDALQRIVKEIFPDIKFAFKSGFKETLPHKPDPALTLLALENMGRVPEEVLYVGDSRTDYQTAKNCNIKPILMDYGYEDPEIIQNLDAEKINNLREVIKKL